MKVNFTERGKLIERINSEQRKRLNQALVKSATEGILPLLTGPTNPIFRSEQKKEITDRNGKLFFKVDYNLESDVLTIYLAEGIPYDMKYDKAANADYYTDSKGNPWKICLYAACYNFNMRNEHLLPIDAKGERKIDIRYDKPMDVLYINFGKKSPAASEEHPDMFGVVRDYDEKGKVIGYAIVDFSESFYRGREDLPELFVEL